MIETINKKGIEPVLDGGMLKFLYESFVGRLLLKILVSRFVSKVCGALLSSRISKPLIKSFVKNNNIDLSLFEADNFTCFNDCFCRKIKEGLRPFDMADSVLSSPCDAFLSAYEIKDDTVLAVKQSEYTLSSLLKNDDLAAKYKNGVCLVFRLCVDHYHRYAYPANAKKSENVFIKGKLHTVRPIALKSRPVFAENCREYTVLETENFGRILQMEVGAMLVGKIKNHHGESFVLKGQEKGMFLYGGSTIILLLENGKVKIPQCFFENTRGGLETPVIMGETIGYKN